MHNIILLSKSLLRNEFRGALPKKKWVAVLAVLLIIACMSPIMIFLFTTYKDLFQTGMEGLALQLSFIMISFLSILTVIFAFPTTFYFSKDTLYLLPLPVKANQIVWAKVIMLFVEEMILMLMVVIPLVPAYFFSPEFSILKLFLVILATGIITVIPLLILGILTLVVMRFMPFFRNKDRFNLIMGIVSIGICLAISFGSSMAGYSSGSGDELQINRIMIAMLQKGGVLDMSADVLFWIKPAVLAVSQLNLLDLVLSVLLVGVLGFAFSWLAELLYLPTVTAANGMQTSNKNKKNNYDASSYMKSGFMAELHELLRSPTYLTNCVLTVFIMPVMLVIMFSIQLKDLDLDFISRLDNPLGVLIPGAITAGILLSFLTGSMNNITATCISRMGTSGVRFMKVIPVSFRKQLSAKNAVGSLFTIIGTLIYLILFHNLFTYPWWIDLFYVLGIAVSCWPSSWIGLFIDGLHPKLIWDSETACVKSGFNMLIDMVIMWALILLLGGGIGLIWMLDLGLDASLWLGAGFLALVCAVLWILMEVFAWKLIEKKLQKETA